MNADNIKNNLDNLAQDMGFGDKAPVEPVKRSVKQPFTGESQFCRMNDIEIGDVVYFNYRGIEDCGEVRDIYRGYPCVKPEQSELKDRYPLIVIYSNEYIEHDKA